MGAEVDPSVRDWPGYLLYRALSGMVGLLPEAVMRRTGEGVGWLASFVWRKRARLARSHMRRVLGDDADVTKAMRRMFASYGRYWAEVFWVRPRRKRHIVEHTFIENVDAVLSAKAAGKGSIYALPHLGNWEAAGANAEAIGVPVLAAAELLSNKRITEWFIWCRNALGIEVAIVESGVTRKLARRLREGGVVALVADRDLKGNGHEVEFFGEKTTMPVGPVALAERTGAALFVVGAFFRPGRGHVMVPIGPVELPDAGTREERLAAGMQVFANHLEDLIRRAPEQWHLLVPNWPSDRDPRP